MDVHVTGTPEQIDKQYRENIVIFRTKEKADFEKWKSGLLKCSRDLLDKIPYDVSSWVFEDIMSELYAEWPDPDKYEQQYQDLSSKTKEINSIVAEFDKEATRLVQQAVQLQVQGK